MSIAEAQAKVLLTRGALDFAFEVAKLTSHALVQKAIQEYRGRDEAPLLITEDDVKSILTPSILEAVIAQLEETSDEEADDGEDE